MSSHPSIFPITSQMQRTHQLMCAVPFARLQGKWQHVSLGSDTWVVGHCFTWQATHPFGGNSVVSVGAGVFANFPNKIAEITGKFKEIDKAKG